VAIQFSGLVGKILHYHLMGKGLKSQRIKT